MFPLELFKMLDAYKIYIINAALKARTGNNQHN